MTFIKDIIEGIADFYRGEDSDNDEERKWNELFDENKKLLERSVNYIDLIEEP